MLMIVFYISIIFFISYPIISNLDSNHSSYVKI